MEVALAYLSVSFGIGWAIKFLSCPKQQTPILSPSPSASPPLPEFLSTMDAGSTGSSSPSSATLQNNPHLALFQSMGQLLRHDPTAVIAQLSAWLSDENSPQFWAPFALSIRGFAYEVMDEWELARMDYVEGLRLYEALETQLGKENAKRMDSNMNFMRIRVRTLPPPRPVPRRDSDYVVIDEGTMI